MILPYNRSSSSSKNAQFTFVLVSSIVDVNCLIATRRDSHPLKNYYVKLPKERHSFHPSVNFRLPSLSYLADTCSFSPSPAEKWLYLKAIFSNGHEVAIIAAMANHIISISINDIFLHRPLCFCTYYFLNHSCCTCSSKTLPHS